MTIFHIVSTVIKQVFFKAGVFWLQILVYKTNSRKYLYHVLDLQLLSFGLWFDCTGDFWTDASGSQRCVTAAGRECVLFTCSCCSTVESVVTYRKPLSRCRSEDGNHSTRMHMYPRGAVYRAIPVAFSLCQTTKATVCVPGVSLS